MTIFPQTKIALCMMSVAIMTPTPPDVQAQTSVALSERFAVIIGGAGGQEHYTEKYLDQTGRMYEWLADSLGYDESRIFYLFPEPSLDSLRIDYLATAENVRLVFGELTKTMKPDDQLFVFMAGHGTHDGDWSKFNLLGPDLKALDFGQMLAGLPSKTVILVNTASASGPFVQRLSGEGRIIITATKSGTQIYETNFADFFLEAVRSEEADFNKDRRVSMEEAFTFARTKQDRWFEDERRMRAEHPLLDDNGDGEGSQDLDESDDGEWASRVYLNPLSPELQKTLRSLESGIQTPKDSLLVTKINLEQEIETLKARKGQMSPQEYSKKLESLLISLARTNRKLKNLEIRQ